jgi:hypothetical protein
MAKITMLKTTKITEITQIPFIIFLELNFIKIILP